MTTFTEALDALNHANTVGDSIALAVAMADLKATYRRREGCVMSERDELAEEISGHPIGGGYCATQVGMDEAREIADAVLAAGYRKPRTIPDEHLLQDDEGEYPVEYPEGTIVQALDGSIWRMDGSFGWDGLDNCSATLAGPATVLYEPEATK